VHEVELNFETGQRALGLERGLLQHTGENVEVEPDLVPVPGAVLATEHPLLDVLAHRDTRPDHAHYPVNFAHRSGLPQPWCTFIRLICGSIEAPAASPTVPVQQVGLRAM